MASLLDKKSELVEVIRQNQLISKKCLGLWLAEKHLPDSISPPAVKNAEFKFSAQNRQFSVKERQKIEAIQSYYRDKK